MLLITLPSLASIRLSDLGTLRNECHILSIGRGAIGLRSAHLDCCVRHKQYSIHKSLNLNLLPQENLLFGLCLGCSGHLGRNLPGTRQLSTLVARLLCHHQPAHIVSHFAAHRSDRPAVSICARSSCHLGALHFDRPLRWPGAGHVVGACVAHRSPPPGHDCHEPVGHHPALLQWLPHSLHLLHYQRHAPHL